MSRKISLKFCSQSVNEIAEIFNSDLTDYDKVYKIYQYGFNPEELAQRFRALYNKNAIDFQPEFLNEIVLFYQKSFYNGDLDLAKYVYGKRLSALTYDYCRFIVESYISEDSYLIEDFFDKYGIDIEIFRFCINAVDEFDVDLFKKFQKIQAIKRKKIHFHNLMTIRDIADAIDTGFFKDGVPFDSIEFLKRIPFKGNSSSIRELEYFLEKYGNKYKDKILGYLFENIGDSTELIAINSKNLYFSSVADFDKIYDEISVLSSDEIYGINQYIKNHEIPLIRATFKIIKNKYTNGELDLENENHIFSGKRKVKYFIIPMCERSN